MSAVTVRYFPLTLPEGVDRITAFAGAINTIVTGVDGEGGAEHKREVIARAVLTQLNREGRSGILESMVSDFWGAFGTEPGPDERASWAFTRDELRAAVLEYLGIQQEGAPA